MPQHYMRVPFSEGFDPSILGDNLSKFIDEKGRSRIIIGDGLEAPSIPHLLEFDSQLGKERLRFMDAAQIKEAQGLGLIPEDLSIQPRIYREEQNPTTVYHAHGE